MHFQSSRYSVPCEYAHLKIYPTALVMVADGVEIARRAHAFEHYLTFTTGSTTSRR